MWSVAAGDLSKTFSDINENLDINDEFIETKNSRISDQSKNGMQVEKVLLACLLSWKNLHF